MRERGLTLLELILALSMVGVVLLASSVLYLSSMRTTISANTDVQLQKELNYVFRDMELELRNTQTGTDLVSFAAGGPGGILSGDKSPKVLPCTWQSSTGICLVVRTEEGSLASPVKKQIAYGYFPNSKKLSRWICTLNNLNVCSSMDYGVLSESVLSPYALGGADLNNDKVVSEDEQLAFDNCMTALDAQASVCALISRKPLFELSNNGKIIYVSFQGKTKLYGPGTGKNLQTSGMTKAINIYHAEG